MLHNNNHPLIRNCPLCDAAVGRSLGKLRFQIFDGSPLSDEFNLVSCFRCGLAFYDTASTQNDFDRYYRENTYYCSSVTTGSGGSSGQDIRRFNVIAQRLSKYITKPDTAIFDVGCGKGGLLSVWTQRGFTQLYAVDMVSSCIEYCKNTHGLRAEIGSALELPFPDIQADVLIYSHIVEHVLDLSGMVAAAKKKLKENGILYVEVPDASRYHRGAGLPYEHLFLEHVNHFDPISLANLFQINGFMRVESGDFLLDTASGSIPCTWAIFRKGDTGELRISQHLEQQLQLYLDWSKSHPVCKEFNQLVEKKIPMFVWGISQFAMLLLGQTSLQRCFLKGFIDHDPYKQSQSLMGRKIQSSGVLRNAGPDDTVLITALGYEDEIIAELREIGFSSGIISMRGKIGCH